MMDITIARALAEIWIDPETTICASESNIQDMQNCIRTLMQYIRALEKQEVAGSSSEVDKLNSKIFQAIKVLVSD